MQPRLNITFPFKRQLLYWFGEKYEPNEGEYLLNHARTGIIMAMRSTLPNGGRVGVVAYNCHTVANAVVNVRCTPVFVDITDELTIDVGSIPTDLDAIVVTNLFGIRNDVEAIRKRCPGAIIIVDNAHGYGLPTEGDFTVYSINQGKFPALGPGGMLVINLQSAIINLKPQIDSMYESLPSCSLFEQLKLFASMLMKAFAYSRCMYWLTMKLKKSANPDVHETVSMKQMAPGVRRLYQSWLPKADEAIAEQKRNAESIINLHGSADRQKFEILNLKYLIGDNAFMAIVRTEDPAVLKAEFAAKGVEVETHFKNAIVWAEQFGYKRGSCPKAEELTTKLLMIPTYTKI